VYATQDRHAIASLFCHEEMLLPPARI
jgi:hypothetical protein